ncbi:hypothetical protein [Kroppenstedtia eburnea]|uniref:Uncharacterized protein n=1 Tax=Kroppenstedtia eburnea TaxID=714067 RepID=A0A1N7INM9_9BACL|nr:hypothetical protein [Kroppenstedtia eburnea]SIS38606.1 hypothetical protein SAMN05421790_101143 [Kroppenstedtia eburnea]
MSFRCSYEPKSLHVKPNPPYCYSYYVSHTTEMMARWIRGKVSELNATDVASGWGIQNYPNQLHLPSQSLFPM